MRRETSHIRTSPRPNCRAKASTKAAKAGYGLMHQSLAAENSVFLHVAPSTTLNQRPIHRRPDMAGPAISLLLGTLRRTQEALAALRIGREAHFNPFSFNPRRPRTKGPDGFPSECIPQHEAPLSAAPKEQDKGASSARTHSEGNPSGPGESHRVIDYPVFCKPAETPVTVERIRLMYSAFFSSAISSWFIRTSRRARTWAMDRAST